MEGGVEDGGGRDWSGVTVRAASSLHAPERRDQYHHALLGGMEVEGEVRVVGSSFVMTSQMEVSMGPGVAVAQ